MPHVPHRNRVHALPILASGDTIEQLHSLTPDNEVPRLLGVQRMALEVRDNNVF
ncbi:MAG TPA: hypothetical protein VKX96_12260 [Chloroflexota bacterium]|nr:hypothetical protein [Chloroflexota bacterium]